MAVPPKRPGSTGRTAPSSARMARSISATRTTTAFARSCARSDRAASDRSASARGVLRRPSPDARPHGSRLAECRVAAVTVSGKGVLTICRELDPLPHLQALRQDRSAAADRGRRHVRLSIRQQSEGLRLPRGRDPRERRGLRAVEQCQQRPRRPRADRGAALRAGREAGRRTAIDPAPAAAGVLNLRRKFPATRASVSCSSLVRSRPKTGHNRETDDERFFSNPTYRPGIGADQPGEVRAFRTAHRPVRPDGGVVQDRAGGTHRVPRRAFVLSEL